MVGEIYLAQIYFTDASTSKVRPILLLKRNSFSDFIYLPITSNLQIKGVPIDNTGLQEGFLPKSSVVVFEKPGVISEVLLIKKIGLLKNDVYINVVRELLQFLAK